MMTLVVCWKLTPMLCRPRNCLDCDLAFTCRSHSRDVGSKRSSHFPQPYNRSSPCNWRLNVRFELGTSRVIIITISHDSFTPMRYVPCIHYTHEYHSRTTVFYIVSFILTP